jgi:hypothetical protein
MMNDFLCECNFAECELILTHEAYYTARDERGFSDQYILNPNCKHIKDFNVVLTTDLYVLAEEKE